MIAVLCDAEDAPAQWAARALTERGLDVDLVTSAELMHARFEHRVDADGGRTAIALPGGRRIDCGRLRGALNRLSRPRVDLLGAVRGADRGYAVEELWAFWLSWLRTLGGPVLNPASPAGLCGPRRDPWDWAARAALARLAVPRDGTRVRRRRCLIVCDGSVIGRSAPAEAIAGARALARAERCPLLGVWFDDRWAFAGATAEPDLRLGGAALCDVLARTFAAA
jgi:hypothetical protein